jgi:hypothetical protein
MLWQFIITGTKERFKGHTHPQPPQKIHPLAWGVVIQQFARGPFLPAAAMVVAVVMPVVFCAKANEKRNKNTKISCLVAKKSFITIYYKTSCNSYIANCSVA